MKRKARLEDWSILNPVDPFDPFSTENPRILMGRVFGHGNFEDGGSITTSHIETLDLDTKLAETLNTQYDLGKMDSFFKNFLIKTKAVAGRYPEISVLEKL